MRNNCKGKHQASTAKVLAFENSLFNNYLISKVMVTTKLNCECENGFSVVNGKNFFVTDHENKLICSRINNTLEFFNIAVAECDFSELQDVAKIVQANGRTRKQYFVIDFDYLCVECEKDTAENIANAIIGFFENCQIHY